jgi:hypothetical protein
MLIAYTALCALLLPTQTNNSRKGSSGAARLATHAVDSTISGESQEERHRMSKLTDRLHWHSHSSSSSANTEHAIAGVEETKGSDV